MMIQKYIKNNKFLVCCKRAIITDFETGEIFCSKCGFVVSEYAYDLGPEWSYSAGGKINKIRVGDGTSLAKHDQGLSTMISSINKDAAGKKLSVSMKRSFKQLRKLDRRSKTYASVDKNLVQAFSELNGLIDKLALSNAIMENTAYIYRKAVERKLVRGRTISAMITASLYAACRDTKTPRTLKDVAEKSNLKRKEISKCYRLLHQELELKVPVVDSIHCIARISSRLEISEKVKRCAIKILESSQKHEFSAGKDPMGLAAAALYIACIKNGKGRTQRNIAEIANITEVTIRNRVKCFKHEQNIKF